MRALTVLPGVANSAQIDEIAEPPVEQGSVLVEMLAVGVCGTDLEIVEGQYGAAPPGAERLVLGHEALGRLAARGFGPGPERPAGGLRRPGGDKPRRRR